MAEAEHRFVSWVQHGVGLAPGAAEIELSLEGAAAVAVTAQGYGPGDVRALDSAAVVRTVPLDGAADFESNLFAAIDLAHPALPWMLSPARTPLLPWLTLVVIEDGPGVRIERGGGTAALVLEAPAELARELPDLEQAWAWVHAHGTGTAGQEVEAALFAHSREPTCARLLCPRRLEPLRRYHAALVPVFAAGVHAALGQAVPAGDELAWMASTALPLRLPAYRLWSFATGAGGDFALLASRIAPRRLGADVGVRAIDASAPGWGLPDAADRTIAIGGMVRALGTKLPAPSEDAVALGQSIANLIDGAAEEIPVLSPPLYGGTMAGVTSTESAPQWLVRLNSDARLRIAAGAGAAIVRARQDELVDEAWRVLGDAEDANQVLHRTELAAVIQQRLAARYVEVVSDDDLLQIIRPAHRRIKLARDTTLAADAADSALPSGGVRAAFRRLTRPTGRIARRARLTGPGGAVLERANRAAISAVPRRAVLDGGAAFDDISVAEHVQVRFSSARLAAIEEAAEGWRGTPSTPAGSRTTYVPDEVLAWTPISWLSQLLEDPFGFLSALVEFVSAVRRHQQYLLEQLRVRSPSVRRPLANGDLATVRDHFRAAAAPARAIAPVLAARIAGHVPAAGQPFRPITVTPSLDRPLLGDLAALDAAHVLPGIADVPADTAALLEVNPDAVAALMVGANQELAAELRWRGYPFGVRETLLRTFWGRRDAPADIPPIDKWPTRGPRLASIGLILLLRGELFRRYPDAIVYLVEARWSGAHRVLGSTERMPLFRVALGADAVLHGFDLKRAAAAGSAPPGAAGWYVVIEEHPREPRFGLGAGAGDAAVQTWRDLAWAHAGADDLRGGTYLRIDGPLASLRPPDDPDLRWGVEASQQAAIALRRPTRVAIHASLLLALRG